ncbi:MAG: transposase [Myxococcaceae bacterium]|nr:transposase [Myxococcaceae bacterium]
MLADAKSKRRDGERSRVPHRRRPDVRNDALHVTVHVIEGLASLRNPTEHALIVEAIRESQERFGCRFTEYSVLSNHVHLIVEAESGAGLAQGMKGLLVRIVRALNRHWGRKGSIFRERFHARVLKTYREIRNAVRYVLLNARKHGIRIPKDSPDPCSSGPWYERWLGRFGPFRSEGSPVVRGRNMYLEGGCYPLWLDINEVPGSWRLELASAELDLTT